MAGDLGGTPMTFLEALKTARPMRRSSQWSYAPQWLHLGHDGGVIEKRPVWRRIDTGSAIGLSYPDYLADDWEVMP
jgi:hypothetical protein